MSKDVAELLNRIPDLDTGIVETPEGPKKKGPPGTFTGPDPGEARQLFDALLEGGSESVTAVVDQLVAIDDGTDYRARYALHGLANYVCTPGKEQARAVFNRALTAALKDDRPPAVKGYLIRQLQWSGTKAIVQSLKPFLLEAELSDDAALALVAIREGAAPVLRGALSEAEGRRLLTLVHALGVLKDKASAQALRRIAGQADGDVRATALWALSAIGERS